MWYNVNAETISREAEMLKRFVCFLLTALFVIAALPAASASEPYEAGTFYDVPEGEWFEDYVKSVYDMGVMQGKGDGAFDPDGPTTRAEFVAVLARLDGSGAAGEIIPFTDVPSDAWYASYVSWAVGGGFVEGYPDGTFRPGDAVPRCETAALLTRFIDGKGLRTIPDGGAVQSFSDVPADAWYAAELEAVRSTGIMKGDPNGAFRPDDPVTRAEAAVLAVRLYDLIAAEELYGGGLPTVRIDTETGRDVESKEEYILTAFSLEAPDGRSINEESVNIRGRGNTAWRVDKKSYKLKFPSKICLANEAECATKAKDWTLIACHFDRSLVRNHIGYRMARALDGIEWTPYSEMVELYLNGEYRGIYMLAEQIEAKKGRVPVDDGEKETIGFLLELDFWSSGEYYVDYFKSMGHKYTIKTDFMDTDQVIAMKCHLEAVYSMMCEGDREKIESCVDLASAVDMYLVNEIYKETDVGTGSVYMYFKEPNGKLYFGPVWDLDGALGNTARQVTTAGLYAGYQINASGRFSGDIGNMWYAALMQHEWFRDLARERWPYVRDTVLRVLSEELKPIYYNMDIFEKNFEIWDILHEDIGGGAPPKTLKFNSCRENVEYMEEWTRDRVAWLDSCFTRADFEDWYPEVSSEGYAPAELLTDHTAWTIPEWYEADNLAQLFFDQIYDLPDEYLEDTRIFVTLGAAVTMTAKNISRVVLGDYMGLDTERFQFVMNEGDLARVRASYQGLGNWGKMIGEIRMGIKDLETGDESTVERIIFTFRKDLSLTSYFES